MSYNPMGRGWRKSMPLAPKGWGQVIVEGHGEIERAMPWFIVRNVEIVIFQGHGIGLDDAQGKDIAEGLGTQVRMPLAWDGDSMEWDTELPAAGGRKVRNRGERQTYREGLACPNYKLYPYDHPDFGEDPLDISDSSFNFKQYKYFNLINLKISEIAKVFEGNQILWDACTVVR